MLVTINETRHHCLAGYINDLYVRSELALLTDLDDLAAVNHDRRIRTSRRAGAVNHLAADESKNHIDPPLL